MRFRVLEQQPATAVLLYRHYIFPEWSCNRPRFFQFPILIELSNLFGFIADWKIHFEINTSGIQITIWPMVIYLIHSVQSEWRVVESVTVFQNYIWLDRPTLVEIASYLEMIHLQRFQHLWSAQFQSPFQIQKLLNTKPINALNSAIQILNYSNRLFAAHKTKKFKRILWTQLNSNQ